MTRPLIVAIALVALCARALPLQAADVPVAGKKLMIVDKLASTGKADVSFLIVDSAVSKGTATDPAGIAAILKIRFDGQGGLFAMPSGSGWIENKASSAKYQNKLAPSGGFVKVSNFKPTKQLKLVAKGLGDVPIDVTAAPSGAVYVGYDVTNGGQEFRHCTVFTQCEHKLVAKGTGRQLVCKAGAPDPTCGAFACGDGVLDAGEACDDGNTASGDGCSAVCQTELTYAWSTGAFGACSMACGSGIQTRTVECRSSAGTIVADDFCAVAGPKPLASQACPNLPACEGYAWNAGPFGSCSATCGPGTQSRTVVCLSPEGTVVDDAFCGGAGPRPPEEAPCELQPCHYGWFLQNPCAGLSCAPPTLPVPVVCLFLQDHVVVDDSFCAAMGPKPNHVQSCPLPGCYEWEAGPFGTCSATCGSGILVRTVVCREVATQTIVADGLCADYGPQPDAVVPCPNLPPCPVYVWVADDWSACSATCGSGVQTRQVRCETSTGIHVSTSLCAASGPPPDAQRPCPDLPPCETFSWDAGPFGACSVPCGGGIATRLVVCRDSLGVVVADSFCASAGPKPPPTLVCNTNPC